MWEAARLAAPDKEIRAQGGHTGGSTDVGDVQHLMPVFTFRTGGITGDLHQVAFDVINEEEAYLNTAKIFALTAYYLLRDQAKRSREIVDDYHPVFASKEEYVAFMEQFDATERYSEG